MLTLLFLPALGHRQFIKVQFEDSFVGQQSGAIARTLDYKKSALLE